MKESDITLITPIRNKPSEIFQEFIQSIENIDSDVVIVDDKSDSDKKIGYKNIIKSLNKKNILFYEDNKRYFLAGGLYKAASLAKTEYVSRLDSDDILIKLPQVEKLPDGYNFYTLKDSHLDICKFIKQPSALHLRIIQKDFFLKTYNYHKVFDPLQNMMPEDLFFHLIFLISSELKPFIMNYAKEDLYRYRRGIPESNFQQVKKNNPGIKIRRDLILTTLLENNIISVEIYSQLKGCLNAKYKNK